MRPIELSILLGEARQDYVLDADAPAETKRGSRPRLLLIVAVIGAMLLLAGCAAVIAMTLKDRNIGEMNVTSGFDEYGNSIETTEKTLSVASMSGYGGSPAQLAAKEWREFTESYEPQLPEGNVVDDPNIPNQYEYTYDCCDQVMVDKVNEIAEKYDLKLLGPRVVSQRWHQDLVFSYFGISGLLRPEAQAKLGGLPLVISPPHNFRCETGITLTGTDSPWQKQCFIDYYYLQKGYFDIWSSFTYDQEATQEWEYTAADGTKLLLALWSTQGIILAQKESADIAIFVDLEPWKVFLSEEDPRPTKEALEAIADCFDYSITTQALPMEGLQEELDKIEDPNAVDFEPLTFGSFADYVQTVRYPQTKYYALADVTGDGTEELLIGDGSGFFTDSKRLVDGESQNFLNEDEWRLCEDGVIERHESFSLNEDENYQYFRLGAQDPLAYCGYEMDVQDWVKLEDGKWYELEDMNHQQEITEAEARAIIAKYTPVELTWRPLTSFPVDEKGNTYGDILAAEKPLTEQELRAFYAENAPVTNYDGAPYQYFALRDINEDGVLDLLLSVDGRRIDVLGTYWRGEWIRQTHEVYLCEGNVFKRVDHREDLQDGKSEDISFFSIRNDRYTQLGGRWHNISKDVWHDRWANDPEIPKEEGVAFVAQYPEIDPGFRPIGELKG